MAKLHNKIYALAGESNSPVYSPRRKIHLTPEDADTLKVTPLPSKKLKILFTPEDVDILKVHPFPSKAKILPSAEDIYISLTSDQLNFIGTCRLAQAEEDENYLAFSKTLSLPGSGSTSGFEDDDILSTTTSDDLMKMKGGSGNSNNADETDFSSIYSSNSENLSLDGCSEKRAGELEPEPPKRRIVQPEGELSNIHFVPDYITAYDKTLEKESSRVWQDEIYSSSLGLGSGPGPIANYSRSKNTENISMRAFGPNRSDSIFKKIFGKFKEQHRFL